MRSATTTGEHAGFCAATVSLDHGTVALRLAGRLDGECAARLHHALHAATVGARAVVVDLSEVTHLGSVGVSALLGAYTRGGGRVHLAGLTHPAVRQVATLLELERHFTVHPDVEGFVDSVR
ncbi:STAS domain-containing protein [Pseudonocardia oroxyli]|uniref:Anti-anti-sigma factor n=1 Tax=Pseudonocardia oroxyli TaxID=366584 RepID=A0A1G7JBN7_PSEOR|nr:STAS domain-containing protein [Pseudonocardia oroxyli]SDF22350.1 anti-anti-sigma factor [Pseudonocardia oroxyli]